MVMTASFELKSCFTLAVLSMAGRAKLSSVHGLGSTWAAFSILRKTLIALS